MKLFAARQSDFDTHASRMSKGFAATLSRRQGDDPRKAAHNAYVMQSALELADTDQQFYRNRNVSGGF